MSYARELKIALEAAHAAGHYLRGHLNTAEEPGVVFKREIDIVTVHDLQAQRMIVETLSNAFPEHAFLAEEELTTSHDGISAYRWILDPLDGTSNYAHGFPYFCVSLALEVAGRIELGVVYAPVADETFSAVRGEKALLNGVPIHVNSTARLTDSIVATGFPYDREANLQSCLSRLGRLAAVIRSPRVMGAAALDICYVACGRLDAYWDVELSPWDMAAAALIAEEAGGHVTNMMGKAFHHEGPTIVASNGILHPDLLEQLHGE